MFSPRSVDIIKIDLRLWKKGSPCQHGLGGPPWPSVWTEPPWPLVWTDQS